MSENCTEIRIGRTAENEARVVRFNVSDWQGIYGPGGAFILMHQRPNDDEPYICQASVAEDGWLEWVVKAADLQRTGRGQLQLSYVVNEQIAKSMIFTTRISRSLDQSGELPEPYEDMIEELIEAAADIVIVGQQVAADKAAADEDALKAEGHAVGKQNGEDVPSDSPYYHNNAKYYAEQAGGSAQAAADSAGDANTAKGKAEDAQTAAETAQGKAEDAQTAAETAQGKAEDAQEAAEAAAETAEEYAEDAAPAIINTASGAIASFSDGAGNRNIKSLIVNIEPVQDLHGQDAPYPAGGGAQLFNTSTINEGKDLDGSGQLVNSSVNNTTDYIPVLPNTKYTISQDSFSGTKTIAFYLSDKTYLSGGSNYTETPYTFTTSATCAYVRFSYAQENTSSLLFNKGEYSNICPITGWTGASAARTGKNLFNKTNTSLQIANADIFNSKIETGTSGRLICFIPCVPDTNYTVSRNRVIENERFQVGYTIESPSNNVSVLGLVYAESAGTIGDSMTLTVKTGENARYLVVWAYWGGQANALDTLQIEFGSTATDYEPYQGTTLTASFGQTVYGGEYEVVSGKVKPYKEYDSYNGETLTGRWMSSIDKYVEGTTPTIGAQVVDFETFDETIQITPNPVSTLQGQNNIWSDAGDVAVEYVADTKLYVDNKIAEMIASALSA